MKFDLYKKDYQREFYKSENVWKNKKVTFSVDMQYHTFLKYWSVSYSVSWGEHFTGIEGKGYIKDRKTARKIAMDYMDKASINDINNKVDKFHRDLILKEG